MQAAKAVVAGLTGFLGLLAARQVHLDPLLEGSLLGIIAFCGVYATANKA